jgi:hypothetical protein
MTAKGKHPSRDSNKKWHGGRGISEWAPACGKRIAASPNTEKS